MPWADFLTNKEELAGEGPNFVDWLRNLKVVLASKKILYVLT